MTSTIGITIGSGAAASAIAAAGAIGLGVLGVGALLRGRGRKKGGRGKKTKGYHGRYSRRAKEEEDEVEDMPEDLEEALNVIRSQDVTGCGLRLVCQLAARDQLTLEEAAILQIVGPAVQPGEGLLPPGAPGEYRAAKGLGQAGGDCGQAFPMCSLNGTQLMETVMAYLP